MNPLFEAAWELHEFLRNHDIQYAIIGGVAVQRWGDIRLTQDVDLTIATPFEKGSKGLVQLITSRFPSRVENAIAFAQKNRMVLATASNGIEVDISIALPGYEDDMLARAIEFEIEPGKRIRLCSAEDLIIHKAVAGRPQDITDIQGIVYRQGEKLDVSYIRHWLSQFSQILENPEVLERFEVAWIALQNSNE